MFIKTEKRQTQWGAKSSQNTVERAEPAQEFSRGVIVLYGPFLHCQVSSKTHFISVSFLKSI